MWSLSGQDTTNIPSSAESGPLTENTRLTGYEPNIFDDYHHSETAEIFFQEQFCDTRLSILHDAELSDETIGRTLSSPLFIQERQEPADCRQASHYFELPVQSILVCHARTEKTRA